MWPPHHLGQHPTVIDPMERKNVYVGTSKQPFADEGLFARFEHDFIVEKGHQIRFLKQEEL